MISMAPLPSWKNLFSIFSFKNIDPKSLSKTWSVSSDRSIWFSKTAWSLLAAAVWKQFRSGKAEITFWVPDYFCNSSLYLLRSKGVKFVFYPIQENREPDYNACKELSKENPVDIFVLVHYFGKPSDANRAFEFCKSRNAVLVEDAAHVLKPIKGIGEKGDFVFYSPHKHLPIPDGAIFIVRNSGPSMISWSQEDELYIRKEISKHYLENRNSNFFISKWILKRGLQKLGIRKRSVSRVDFLKDESSEIVADPFISSVSKRILSEVIPKVDRIARKKIRIQKIWDEILLNEYHLKSDRTSNKNWIPYLSEYSLDTIDATQSMFQVLSSKGYPVSTWPDLPPETSENPNRHKNAILLRRTSFFLGIHGSLSEKEISSYFLKDKKVDSFKLQSQELDWNSWNRELESIEHVNLLQSWEYGEAKKQSEGWQPKRILLKSNDKKIALVQILSKRLLILFRIFRINRGPLFYSNVTVEEKRTALLFLSEYASLFKGSILFFSPEMNSNGADLITIHRTNYIRRNASIWSSSYVNLSLNEEDLRKNLDGKWRNMLNAAEKNDLGLIVSDDEKDFQWMLERYTELMVKNEFSGIPISFLAQLRQCFSEKEKPLLLIATREDERIACVCLIVSNRTGMYLVGWNGEEGRRLKANQFLLWNSILELKKRGYRWFDLGGIDEDNTPTIAEFKLGINGERYELAGEFLSF
ncbi:lipid II:glycine glycyltransferase FemX [Leptospira yasudae]|uniref:Glycosyltransferase n=1 Tax=Leptospira yasudae TaxID=2202201 RepID=A0ABX9LZ99_9LEPT|nr:peptidoglycan bridge formation glycyltransferase FemA/FemB family protein [Leptospira yasudae]RHX78254.1 glycosyltransferase [Leptospira yasudae]